MHTPLVRQIARARQSEIARTSARRRRFAIARAPKAIGPAARSGGMLHLWRHGSPAHGS